MKQKVLIVEDNISLSQRQKDWLEQAGYDVMTAMHEPAARALIRKHRFDFILSDVRLPEGDGISLLEWLTKEKKDIPFIVTTEYGSIPDAVRAIKLGAKDYLPKPVHREHLLELAEEIFRPLATVRTKPKDLFRRTCPKILEVERYARIVAPSDMSVLILGANGTGKESVAQGIHANSGRDGKFVAVNCGALPRELAASLLFGHEKGAFTGADTAKNENLERAIKEGRFREDLYHRLAEMEIRMPSLAECADDILPLAEFFRERFSKELKKETKGFSKDAIYRLRSYRWPGNVRELQNRIKRAVLLTETPVLELPDLNADSQTDIRITEKTPDILPLKDENSEREAIANALQACNGHREQTARLLNVNSSTLYRKMKKYGIR